jgi:hypothetical protein
MVAEGRLEWTPIHDRSLWPQLGFEKRKQMAAAHGLGSLTEDRDTEWVPIRNREYVAAPSQLELEGEDDWVLWIEADSDLEPDDQDGETGDAMTYGIQRDAVRPRAGRGSSGGGGRVRPASPGW